MEKDTTEITQSQKFDSGVVQAKTPVEATQAQKSGFEVVQAKAPVATPKIKFQEPDLAQENPTKIGKTLKKKLSTPSFLSRSHSSSSISSRLQSKSKIENEDVDVSETNIGLSRCLKIEQYSQPKSELILISPPAKGTNPADHLDIVVVQVLLETPDRTWTYLDPTTSSVQGGSKETEKVLEKMTK